MIVSVESDNQSNELFASLTTNFTASISSLCTRVEFEVLEIVGEAV